MSFVSGSRFLAAVAAETSKVSCVGIVGSSGAVGQEMLRCLEARNFPTENARLFANRAAGQTVKTSSYGDVLVEKFSVAAAQQCDIVLMAVSGDFSKEFSPQISGGPKSTRVIDNSSAFRYHEDIPLVIPEINGDRKSVGAPLVANPNCTTAIGAMALWPLHQKYKLKKVMMSTYQSASGAGAEGMDELLEGCASFAKDGVASKPKHFKYQLPFNVIPQIDAFQENGYTKEEMKVAWELKKIFGLPDDVAISCTAVRVPTLRAHSESIIIETELPIDPDEARELLSKAPGVKVVDNPETFEYPMPLDATGEEDIQVGRIRQSLVFGKHGLEFFVSGDQLLRGAALNAVLIAEHSVRAEASAASGSLARDVPMPLHGPVRWEMHKFGGASLADAALFRTCGDILLEKSIANGTSTPTAAVVSAMKGMTDKLVGVVEAATKPNGETEAKQQLKDVVKSHISTARQLLRDDPNLVNGIAKNIESDSQDIAALLRSVAVLKVVPNSTMEFVAGMGEVWSAQLLCAYLKTKGAPTAWLNARDVLIVESNSSGLGAKGAALDMRVEPNYTESAKRLESWWQEQSQSLQGDAPPVVVVTGFVASTMEGVPTTLKRSGSDYSATIFASLLKASSTTMWKNVDGVLNCDPGAVAEASTVKSMSYDEAIELAYFGGQVLHPTAMGPSIKDNTPVYVKNVFNPGFHGTTISKKGETSTSPVKFITSIPSIALVNIRAGSWASVSKVAGKAMGAMDDAGVKVVLVTQACASHSISVAVDEAEGQRAVQAIEQAFELELSRGNIEGVSQEQGYSIMAVVGDEMKGSVGTLGRLTEAFAKEGIGISAMAPGSSGRNVALVLEKSKLKSAMAATHKEFANSGEELEEFSDAAQSLSRLVASVPINPALNQA